MSEDLIIDGRHNPKPWRRKLSAEQVAETRMTEATLEELSRRFGISTVALWKVRNRKTYRELP